MDERIEEHPFLAELDGGLECLLLRCSGDRKFAHQGILWKRSDEGLRAFIDSCPCQLSSKIRLWSAAMGSRPTMALGDGGRAAGRSQRFPRIARNDLKLCPCRS